MTSLARFVALLGCMSCATAGHPSDSVGEERGSGGAPLASDAAGNTALPSGGTPANSVFAGGGGAAGTGGVEPSDGGRLATQGGASAGGVGGRALSGGRAAFGGTSPAAGQSGAGPSPGVGGSAAASCAWEQGPAATDGSLTCYWFAQGTARDELTCPGGYKTYCGYCGSETGERPQGDGPNWCPIQTVESTVANISTGHFVAIHPALLAQGKNCGMCVEVAYRGRRLVATVVDACPSCVTEQHIDLNLSAAEALGLTEQMGQVEGGVTWRAVGCPATGDIQVGFNGGYQGQVYFQNTAFPIATASSGGREASVNTGFWDFGKEMGGEEITLTDVLGHRVTAAVPPSGGGLGVQFELTCL